MTSRGLILQSSAPENARCVIYVMSRDQRAHDNHALLAAQSEALKHSLPLVVVFNLYTSLGVRAQEHFTFMLAGLREVETELSKKNIPFLITSGDMEAELKKLVTELNPRTVYFDFSPLRGPREAQKSLVEQLVCRVIVVDTHNIVPVWILSDKQEFAAHTIRRKLHKSISEWLVEPPTLKKHPYTIDKLPKSLGWSDTEAIVKKVPKCGIQHDFEAGETAAKNRLATFIESGLASYAGQRNDPTKDAQSELSPYLHFGQLSALRVVLNVMDAASEPPLLLKEPRMPSTDEPATFQDGVNSLVEELVVRKELSDNFCLYNNSYDSLNGAPSWGQKTLEKHATDPRDFTYTRRQFEDAKTHDDIWNAAQLQLRKSGKIHGYMRMYWAKKILEWSDSAEKAVETAIYLNDHYSLDGGDPNGYVGILWSVAGLHDRPWFERSVYGTIRYMNDSGLKKKFDTKAYTERWL